MAPPEWRAVGLISDLHLQSADPATFDAWQRYMHASEADAVFILGDLFEAWVGDDAAALPGFEARCAEVLRAAALTRPVFFMHGNRDFLIGAALARQTGLRLIEDPTVLVMQGRRWLLSHGDLLCLEDVAYLEFRSQVRDPQWQKAVLARSIDERRQLAGTIRGQSEDHKRSVDRVWADVDADAARTWLARARAPALIHGHTHKPAEHPLGDGLQRIVLSDWDMTAQPPRAQVLCLSSAGARRVELH